MSFFSSSGPPLGKPPGPPRPPPTRQYAMATASSALRGRKSDAMRFRIRARRQQNADRQPRPWMRANAVTTSFKASSFVSFSTSPASGTASAVVEAATAAKNWRCRSAAGSAVAELPPQFSVESGGSALPFVFMNEGRRVRHMQQTKTLRSKSVMRRRPENKLMHKPGQGKRFRSAGIESLVEIAETTPRPILQDDQSTNSGSMYKRPQTTADPGRGQTAPNSSRRRPKTVSSTTAVKNATKVVTWETVDNPNSYVSNYGDSNAPSAKSALQLAELPSVEQILRNEERQSQVPTELQVTSAFRILDRMVACRAGSEEADIVAAAAGVLKRAVYCEQVQDTRLSDENSKSAQNADFVLIPNTLHDSISPSNTSDHQSQAAIFPNASESSEGKSISSSMSWVGVVVRIDASGSDLDPDVARQVHSAIGVVESQVIDEAVSDSPAPSHTSKIICVVRLASGEAVSVSTERLSRLRGAKESDGLASDSKQFSRKNASLAPSSVLDVSRGSSAATNSRSTASAASGVPFFTLTSQLHREVTRLNNRESMYEKRLEGHRAARADLRLEKQRLIRDLRNKDEEIAAEKERHRNTRILSEKRRQACVKLRNQGVSLVRANNSLETRKIMEERELKYKLKTCNLTLAETRVALEESQGALTTLQRELIAVLQGREDEEQADKDRGVPRQIARMKKDMKECETALAMQRGQYMYLQRALAKERRQEKGRIKEAHCAEEEPFFLGDISTGTNKSRDLRIILGPGVIQKASKSSRAIPSAHSPFFQTRTGASVWMSRIPRELQWEGRYFVQMPVSGEMTDFVGQLWLAWDSWSASVRRREINATRGGSNSVAEARVAALCEEGRQKSKGTSLVDTNANATEVASGSVPTTVESSILTPGTSSRKGPASDDEHPVVRPTKPDPPPPGGHGAHVSWHDVKQREQTTEFLRWVLGFIRAESASVGSTSAGRWVRRTRTWLTNAISSKTSLAQKNAHESAHAHHHRAHHRGHHRGHHHHAHRHRHHHHHQHNLRTANTRINGLSTLELERILFETIRIRVAELAHKSPQFLLLQLCISGDLHPSCRDDQSTMLSHLKTRIIEADAEQSGLISRFALAQSVRATFPLLNDIEVEALVGLCEEVPHTEAEEKAEADAIKKECEIVENGSEAMSVRSGSSRNTSRSSLVSRPGSRASTIAGVRSGSEVSGSGSSSSSDSEDSDGDGIEEGLSGEALVLAVKKRREKISYPHELVAYGTFFEEGADQRVHFVKTLFYLHLSSCLQFKADIVKLIRMSCTIPVQGPYKGKSVITLRTLRKCIASIDPMRPEDSVIGVVDTLHRLACRVCDHKNGDDCESEDGADGGEQEDKEEEANADNKNAEENGVTDGDSSNDIRTKMMTTTRGSNGLQIDAAENGKAQEFKASFAQKGKVPTSKISIVLSDSGHIIPLEDLIHVLQWCGCINRRFDWIK